MSSRRFNLRRSSVTTSSSGFRSSAMAASSFAARTPPLYPMPRSRAPPKMKGRARLPSFLNRPGPGFGLVLLPVGQLFGDDLQVELLAGAEHRHGRLHPHA